MKKVILVTGIGGNVGQGILRIIKDSYRNIKIIGVNTEENNAGIFWCDKFFKVPFALREEEYILKIIKIIVEENVDLIIPSTDFETYVLSKNSTLLKCKLASNTSEVNSIFLDKYETFLNFSRKNILFSKTILPSEYQNQFEYNIVKPRKGRGSRGITYNQVDFNNYPDNEYIVQELHKGIEITTSIYVSYINKKILGILNLERKLENGYTLECSVYNKLNKEFEYLVYDIVKNYNIVGSFNLQSIVDNNNNIHPFEINCRISGTNSIRHNLGFIDVCATINELLFNNEEIKFNIKDGKAIRFLSDIIYTNDHKTGIIF